MNEYGRVHSRNRRDCHPQAHIGPYQTTRPVPKRAGTKERADLGAEGVAGEFPRLSEASVSS